MNSLKNSKPDSTGTIVWTLARRLAMVVVLALAFILSAAVTIYVVFRGGNTRVPDVMGKSEIDAKNMIESGQLEFRVQRRNDDHAPMNTVIETRPAANSAVKKNSVVTVVISNGPGQTKSQNFIEADQFWGCGLPVQSTPAEIFAHPTAANPKPQISNQKTNL
jgi:serine/threonine-protein kinase